MRKKRDLTIVEQNTDMPAEGQNTVQKVGKRKPGRKRKRDYSVMTAQPGEISKMIERNLIIYNLPPIDTTDGKAVEGRINEYFKLCMENDMRPSVTGMALALYVDRATLWNWCKGNTRNHTHFDAVKRAYDFLNVLMEEYMQNGKINPVSGIFLMKNNFGYTDKQEVVVTPNNPLGDEQDVEALRARYIETVCTEVPNPEQIPDTTNKA